MNPIKFSMVFLIMVVLFFYNSCAEEESYIIGFTSSLSGPNSDMGEAGRNGVLLAVEEINKNGGLKGRQVEVLIKDHQLDASQLSHIIGGFHDAGAQIVLGPLTSEITKAILPIADAMDLLIISPTASSKEFLDIDDNLIRLNSTTLEKTQYYADYLINNANFKYCGVLYDSQNESFTKSWLNEFTLQYKDLGGEILSVKDFNSKIDTDFKTELDLILNSGVEALLIIANSIDSAAIIQQLRQVDSTLPVFVSEWAGTNQLIELGGKAVEGVKVLQSFNPFDDSESYKSFYNLYLERFHSKPTFASVLSYDTCLVLFQALDSRTDNQSLKAAILENGPYQGVQETIYINSFGDVKRNAVLSVIKDGQFRKIE